MNQFNSQPKSTVSDFQLKQFQDLVAKLYQCCTDRMQYQSERFDLPVAELRCLVLFSGERYLTAKGIAQKLNVVKSRVTRILSGLEKRGLIQRVKDPEDSRVTLLSLTTGGQSKLGDINAFNDFVHQDVLTQMEPEQRKTMLTNLDLLKASMEAVKELMV
jgi:DNA-binding MarR family transcriptional regulator